MNKKLDILSSSYEDIRHNRYDYAVLPWGATEPHNYHLPYLTDCYLSHDISVDAVTKAYTNLNVLGMVLPPIPLGSQNPGQYDVAFCLHARYETQKAILSDIVASLNRQKIYKLVIINGHGGNNFKNMVRDLAVDYPDFLIVTVDWFKVVSPKDYFENLGDHADELETSVLMHYRPHLVDLSVAGDGDSSKFGIASLNEGFAWTPRNWRKVSKDTGIGNPHKSTAEKGLRYANAVTDKLSELFFEIVTKDIY